MRTCSCVCTCDGLAPVAHTHLLAPRACPTATTQHRAQKKAEREAMLRHQFEEKRAERVQKYQVRRWRLPRCTRRVRMRKAARMLACATACRSVAV